MDYAQPQALAESQWVEEHWEDPAVRLVLAERRMNPAENPRIPGSSVWLWGRDMQQAGIHDIPDRAGMEDLCGRSGIGNGTTVVLYGIGNDWYAAFAFWLLKMHGHADARILPGGMKKWSAEGRPTTSEAPQITPAAYTAQEPDGSLRALRDGVSAAIGDAGQVLVDVRSPKEFGGEVFAPDTPTKFGERAGRIPGAVHVPWNSCAADDGGFKSMEELQGLFEGKGITQDQEMITYCTIGARSAYVWFVAKYLVGFPKARLYDGSWGEWGNLIGAPIEK